MATKEYELVDLKFGPKRNNEKTYTATFPYGGDDYDISGRLRFLPEEQIWIVTSMCIGLDRGIGIGTRAKQMVPIKGITGAALAHDVLGDREPPVFHAPTGRADLSDEFLKTLSDRVVWWSAREKDPVKRVFLESGIVATKGGDEKKAKYLFQSWLREARLRGIMPMSVRAAGMRARGQGRTRRKV